MKRITLAFVTLVGVTALSSAWSLDKTPNYQDGDFWRPLALPQTGIYADSFIFTGATGETLAELGVYLRDPDGNGGGNIRFYLLQDGGNAPTSNILATSLVDVSTNSQTMTLLAANTTSFSMVNGVRYWVAAQAMTEADIYITGGHVQNSIYNDNGTFWFSNANDLNIWDGQALTPEMSIHVKTTGEPSVPGPAAVVPFAVGLVAAARRRKK